MWSRVGPAPSCGARPRPMVPCPSVARRRGERRSQPWPGDLALIGWRKAAWRGRRCGWCGADLRSAPVSRASRPGLKTRGAYPVAEPPDAERIRPAVRPGMSERPGADVRPTDDGRPSAEARPNAEARLRDGVRPGAGDRSSEGERPRKDDRPRKGDRPRRDERPRKGERPIWAGLFGVTGARSAEGERLNTEPPSRDRPIRDRPNRELFRRERARLEFRALLAPPSPPQVPPSMPSPRRAPNLTLAALPPSAPAIVPLESPEPRREPPAARAAPSVLAPSEPPWPSLSRGSRRAGARLTVP